MSAQDVIADVLVEHHYVAGIFGTAIDDSLGNKRPSTSHRVRWRESAIRIAVDDDLSDAMSELIDSGFSFDDVRDALALVDLVDLWDQECDS